MANSVVSWRSAAVVGLAASLASACWVQSGDVLWSDETWSWRSLALHIGMGTVLTGGGWFLGMRLVQHGSSDRGSRPVVELLTEVRRTGRVPEGLESAGWLPVLARRRRDLTWIAVVVIGLGVVVTVAVGAAASGSGPQAPGIWALVVVLVILMLAGVRVVLRERRVVDGMLTTGR